MSEIERKLSPQGYNITKDPTNANPFWDEDVPAGQGVPAGGLTGQALVKKSDADYDTEWKDVGGGGTVTVDAALSETSENPVQNKVITKAIADNYDALSADIETAENNAKDYVDDKLRPQTFSATYSIQASTQATTSVTIVVPKSAFTLKDGQRYRATIYFTGRVETGATGKAPSPGISIDFIYRTDSTFRFLMQRVIDFYMTVIDYDGEVELESQLRIYGPGTGYLTTIYTGRYEGEDCLLRFLLTTTPRPAAVTMFNVSAVLYEV